MAPDGESSSEREPGEERQPGELRESAWSEVGDEPTPVWRDAPPDYLSPIDESAPVSGHRPASERDSSHAAAPEHDWATAIGQVYPVLRPAGTRGTLLTDLAPEVLAQEGLKKHALPLLDEGPAGLSVAYAIREPAFDALVNADHLLSWGIEPATLREAAMANLRSWSATAPWSDEMSGERRLLSSDTTEGCDAARILLDEVRAHLASELGGNARVLVAMPDRDLLVAGSLASGDAEFAGQLAAFVAEVSEGANEPIDRRLFELVGDDHRLVPFAG